MSTTVIIQCISWLIKVTDNNDAWWKPEIYFEGRVRIIESCRFCAFQINVFVY